MALSLASQQKLAQSPVWNLLLLTIGSFLFAFGAQGIAASHGFLTGGVFGSALLIWYASGWLSPSIWYAIINIPLFILSWVHVGRKFLLYSLYAATATTVFSEFITVQLPVKDPLYAAIAAGIVCGIGTGIQLRTLGSAGGTDVVAVMLKARWNIPIGQFSFAFNVLVFLAGSFLYKLDLIIASVIMMFISANTLEYVLGLFNRRKMVLIISERGEEVCEAILATERFGVTLLRGKGAYSGTDKEILLTITNNVALKRLENLVYSVDPRALFVVENTFYVSGGQFARRDR